MIVGFDNDDPSIFEEQYQFLQKAQIPFAMLNFLMAVPPSGHGTRGGPWCAARCKPSGRPGRWWPTKWAYPGGRHRTTRRSVAGRYLR
jgi:hypothetical protein